MTKDSNILIDTCTFSHLFGERWWNNNTNAKFPDGNFNEKLKNFKDSFFKIKPNCYITDMTYIEIITGLGKKYSKEIDSVLKEFKFTIVTSNIKMFKYVPSIFNELETINFNDAELLKIKKIKYEATSEFFSTIIRITINLILYILSKSNFNDNISDIYSNFLFKFQYDWEKYKTRIEKFSLVFLEKNYDRKKISLLKEAAIPFIENIFFDNENCKLVISHLKKIETNKLYNKIFNKVTNLSNSNLKNEDENVKIILFMEICSSIFKEKNMYLEAAYYILGDLFYKKKSFMFNDLVDAYNFFVREYENINKIKLEYFTIDMKWYRFNELLKAQKLY